MKHAEGWKHKDTWTKRGSDFAVEVTRSTVEPSPYCQTGPHLWCVYAYIYPAHPHFAKFSGESMFQDAACDLPLHGGPTYLHWHRDASGTVKSVQVGCDYNHLHDEHYTFMQPEKAAGVFYDAQELHDWLAQSARPAAPKGGPA